MYEHTLYFSTFLQNVLLHLTEFLPESPIGITQMANKNEPIVKDVESLDWNSVIVL